MSEKTMTIEQLREREAVLWIEVERAKEAEKAACNTWSPVWSELRKREESERIRAEILAEQAAAKDNPK